MSTQQLEQEGNPLTENLSVQEAAPLYLDDSNGIMPVARVSKSAKRKMNNRKKYPLSLPTFYSATLGKPIIPVKPVTWARLYPTIAHYYQYHPPDFSGMNLYMAGTQYPVEYESVAMRSPASFSMGIVHSEMSKLVPSAPHHIILAIKGHALALMNQMIHDPSQSPGTDLALGIASLVAHDLVFVEDGGIAGAHLDGLRNLLCLRGGFEILDGHPAIQNLVHAVDGLHAYFSGKPRVFPVGQDARITAMDNPLRLAIQPTRSGFSQSRLRNHLLISIGAPLQGILNNMLLIKGLACKTLQLPYSIAPPEAYRQAKLIESDLLRLGTLHDTFGLHASIFSQEDRTIHDVVIESVRCTALLLLSCICRKIDLTPGSAACFNYSLEAVHMANSDLCRHDCHIVQFWALFIEASLTTAEPLKKHILARWHGIHTRHYPGVLDWIAARACFDSMFYVPEVQDSVSLPLWQEIERGMAEGMLYD